MNQTINRKINKLIEESFSNQIANFLKDIGVIPKKILDGIKKQFRSGPLEESQNPAPKIGGTTNAKDTCYTAVMKLINKNNLIKKYDTLDEFIEAYRKKNNKKVTLNQNNIKELKPGTILIHEYIEPDIATVNRSYGKFGISQQDEKAAGHIEIYLGTDPNKNNKHVILGNESIYDDRYVTGSGLELTLRHETDKSLAAPFNKKYWKAPEALDYNTIVKM